MTTSSSPLSHTLPRLTYSLLQQQNYKTSQEIIQFYSHSQPFQTLANIEELAILKRDTEDDEKLQQGIKYAQEKGLLKEEIQSEPYVEIDVVGKSPNNVSEEILNHVNQWIEIRIKDKKYLSHDKKKKCNVESEGIIILLCGLSGTGKGTTVQELQHKLTSLYVPVVTWSNGNLFRTITLLALTWWDDMYGKNSPFDAQYALTKENVSFFMSMLHLKKSRRKIPQERTTLAYDIQIDGLHYHKIMVSDIQNTELKSSLISQNLPSVAKYTQGEVILFSTKAIERMKYDGMTILVEGRKQTLNFVQTPLRYTLVLSDRTLIGKRRAAQKIMAQSLASVDLENNYVEKDEKDFDVTHVIDRELTYLLNEVGILK